MILWGGGIWDFQPLQSNVFLEPEVGVTRNQIIQFWFLAAQKQKYCTILWQTVYKNVILKPWIWHFRCSHHFETRLDKQEWALMEKPGTRQANTLWLINYKAALHHSLLYCLFPVTGTETPNWDHKLVREVFTEVINQVRRGCFPFFYTFL